MTNTLKRFPGLLLSLLVPLAANSAGFAPDVKDLPELPSLPKPELSRAVPLKDWTVLFFVNGKNNLEAYTLVDVNQMELVGTTPRVNIVIEMGRMNGQPEGDDHSEGDWTGVRRYLVTKDADTSRINSPVVEDRGRADMGSWKELADFIKWAKTRYPARRYALVMWDHGNGWKPLDPANGAHFNDKGFSLDEETGSEISTPQMTRALQAAGGVDFLMLDGCNMQMASVAYELKDQAAALTASEETEPGMIVRYAQFLALLDARPAMGAEEFAVNTVRTYRDYFQIYGGDNEGGPVTQSALRLKKMVPFREKLDAWALAAMQAEPEALRQAKQKAKIFGEDPEYKDLYDFVSLVTSASRTREMKFRGQDLLRFMKDELIIENWAQDAVSHGLSIYVPDAYDPLYDGLAFARDGRWDDFARFMAANFGRRPPAK